MLMRARKRLDGAPGDECNDCYLKIEGGAVSASSNDKGSMSDQEIRNNFVQHTLYEVIRASETDGGTIELRLDSKEGKLLAEVAVPNTGGKDKWQTVKVPANVKEVGVHDLVLIFKGEPKGQNLFYVNWITFITPNSETSKSQ